LALGCIEITSVDKRLFSVRRAAAVELLDNFNADLSLLKRVPLLDCLADGSPPGSALGTAWAPESGCAVRRRSLSDLSLHDWIASKEPDGSLAQLASDARRGLAELGSCAGDWRAPVDRRVANDQMKQVKGLAERLHQLDRGLDTMRAKMVSGRAGAVRFASRASLLPQAEQKQLVGRAASKEQETLNCRGDMGRLAEVCAAQFDDLQLLLQNHKRLLDIARRFFDAKNELLDNIRLRLQWVSDCHQAIQAGDCKLLLNRFSHPSCAPPPKPRRPRSAAANGCENCVDSWNSSDRCTTHPASTCWP